MDVADAYRQIVSVMQANVPSKDIVIYDDHAIAVFSEPKKSAFVLGKGKICEVPAKSMTVAIKDKNTLIIYIAGEKVDVGIRFNAKEIGIEERDGTLYVADKKVKFKIAF